MALGRSPSSRASRKWHLINWLAAKTKRIPDKAEVKRLMRMRIADLEVHVRNEIEEFNRREESTQA